MEYTQFGNTELSITQLKELYSNHTHHDSMDDSSPLEKEFEVSCLHHSTLFTYLPLLLSPLLSYSLLFSIGHVSVLLYFRYCAWLFSHYLASNFIDHIDFFVYFSVSFLHYNGFLNFS